jgi:hypothetical protein
MDFKTAFGQEVSFAGLVIGFEWWGVTDRVSGLVQQV